jgi:hypothetical protein
MRYYYVQLNEQSVVNGAIDTHAEINSQNMIRTESFRPDLLDWSYINGEFIAPPPVVPAE